MLSKTELKKIKKELPKPWIKNINEQLEKSGNPTRSRQHIEKVLKGDAIDPTVIAAAISIINDKKKEVEDLKQAISELNK